MGNPCFHVLAALTVSYTPPRVVIKVTDQFLRQSLFVPPLTSSPFGRRCKPIGPFIRNQIINIIGHFDVCGILQ
jgi:hypothetical protein